MNKLWVGALVGLAMGMGFASPTLADNNLPPPRYDIGGTTETEVLDDFRAMFGWGVVTFERLPAPDQIKSACNAVWASRGFRQWEAATSTEVLMGCQVPGNPVVIIYQYDDFDPWLAARLLRHEIGHFLGWSGSHER